MRKGRWGRRKRCRKRRRWGMKSWEIYRKRKGGGDRGKEREREIGRPEEQKNTHGWRQTERQRGTQGKTVETWYPIQKWVPSCSGVP